MSQIYFFWEDRCGEIDNDDTDISSIDCPQGIFKFPHIDRDRY